MNRKRMIREALMKEGKRVKLDSELESAIDNIIDNLIPAMFKKYEFRSLKNANNFLIDEVKYNELGSDIESKCDVIGYFDKEDKGDGFFDANDHKNPDDNVIGLNFIHLKVRNENEFKKVWEQDKERYRDVLVHEFTHAIDPKTNRHKSDTSSVGAEYSTDRSKYEEYVENYLTHDIEVLAQSTAFFNRIIRTVKGFKKEYSNNQEALSMMDNNLDNLLKSFAEGNFNYIMTNEFQNLMRGVLPNKFINFLNKTSSSLEKFLKGNDNITAGLVDASQNDPLLKKIIIGGKEDDFWINLSSIYLYKQFNPKAWKSFLKKLYHTVQEAKDILKEKEEVNEEIRVKLRKHLNNYDN